MKPGWRISLPICTAGCIAELTVHFHREGCIRLRRTEPELALSPRHSDNVSVVPKAMEPNCSEVTVATTPVAVPLRLTTGLLDPLVSSVSISLCVPTAVGRNSICKVQLALAARLPAQVPPGTPL